MKLKLGSMRVGSAGKAQEILVELEESDPRDHLASIGSWFIDAPNQSPQ